MAVSSIIGGVAKIAGGLIGGGGKKAASTASVPQLDFSGLMTPSNNAPNLPGSPLQSSFQSLADKFPDNPAYSLASQAEKIFVPQIRGVDD